MLSHYGLGKVLRVEAYVQGTIRLMGVNEGRNPFIWLGDRGNQIFLDHVIEGAFDLFLVLDKYLVPGMLARGDRRFGPDGIGPRYVAYCIEGAWEGPLQGNDVLDSCCGGRGSHFCWLYLEG